MNVKAGMSDEKTIQSEDRSDIFRDTPIRYLGYANEVGESFRNVVHRNVVRFSYVISGSYVIADAVSKAQQPDAPVLRTFADVAIWQGLASVMIPGFVINRICWGANRSIKHHKYKSIIVTTSGLLAIPLIIKPIDHTVDTFMDKFMRPKVLKYM